MPNFKEPAAEDFRAHRNAPPCLGRSSVVRTKREPPAAMPQLPVVRRSLPVTGKAVGNATSLNRGARVVAGFVAGCPIGDTKFGSEAPQAEIALRLKLHPDRLRLRVGQGVRLASIGTVLSGAMESGYGRQRQ